MKKLKSSLPTFYVLRSTANPQGGFAFVAVIIIVVLAFSIMLVSGATDYGFSPPEGGNTSDGNSSGSSPAPTSTTSATLQPTQPAISQNYTAIVQLTGCTTGKEPYMQGSAEIKGNAAAQIILEVQNGSTFQTTNTVDFTSPTTRYNLSLLNSRNFNTKNWRLRAQNTTGTNEIIYEGTPTNC